MGCGRGEVIRLPEEEVVERLSRTTEEWPIANVHIPGYGRDQCMASHMSNHITIGYGDIVGALVATCLQIAIPTRVVPDTAETLA